MNAVLFDLDDTIYREMDFVESGFSAVARVVAERFDLNEREILTRLLAALRDHGRGQVFDIVMKEFGLDCRVPVEFLVWVYRTHVPNIRPDREAIQCLEGFRANGWRVGLVTDGMGSVQRRKIEALGISGFFDVIVCTDELGREFWKPSTVPFDLALQWLQAKPERSAYVGDNVKKDFIGPNRLGMATLQLAKYPGSEPDDAVDATARAQFQIDTLSEAEVILERMFP
jgi:putative hydrolase of the HAD superfamily